MVRLVGIARRCFLGGAGAVLSVAICVACLSVWLRSYWRYDRVDSPRLALQQNGQYFVMVDSLLGAATVTMTHVRTLATPVGPPSSGHWRWSWRPLAAYERDGFILRCLWFDCGREQTPVPTAITHGSPQLWTSVYVRIPYWLPMILGTLTPVLWLRSAWRRRRQRSRAAKGLCAACGYDMRGIDSRCPECGTILPEKRNHPKTSGRS